MSAVARTLARLSPLLAGVVGAFALYYLYFAAVAVGRRDGLPLDVWLAHAVRLTAAPKALTTLDTPAATPEWVRKPARRMPIPAPLTLPADAIDDRGLISLGHTTAAVVAAGTVNLALRTPDGAHTAEQQAYYRGEDERITHLRVMCSGFRPTLRPTP